MRCYCAAHGCASCASAPVVASHTARLCVCACVRVRAPCGCVCIRAFAFARARLDGWARSQIWSVALDDDCTTALSAGHDSTARVWAVSGGTGDQPRPPLTKTASLATLKHPKWVSSVSTCAGLAATGCGDTQVRLFCLRTYACLHTLPHGGGVQLRGGGRGVSGVSWICTHMVGGGLLSGGEAGTIKVWALPSELLERSRTAVAPSAPRTPPTADPSGAAEPPIEPQCVATLEHGHAVRGLAALPLIGGIVSVGGRSSDSVVTWWANPLTADTSASSLPQGGAAGDSLAHGLTGLLEAGGAEADPEQMASRVGGADALMGLAASALEEAEHSSGELPRPERRGSLRRLTRRASSLF